MKDQSLQTPKVRIRICLHGMCTKPWYPYIVYILCWVVNTCFQVKLSMIEVKEEETFSLWLSRTPYRKAALSAKRVYGLLHFCSVFQSKCCSSLQEHLMFIICVSTKLGNYLIFVFSRMIICLINVITASGLACKKTTWLIMHQNRMQTHV